MPGVLLDTSFHRHPHSLHASSPAFSSPISTSNPNLSPTPPSSSPASASDLPLPHHLRFGDLTPPPSLSPSLAPPFFLHSPPSAPVFLPALRFFGSPSDSLRRVDEELDENATSRKPSAVGFGLNSAHDRGEFDGLQLVPEDGDGGPVAASFHHSSGCESEGVQVPDAGMVAAAAANHGSSAAGACMVGSPVFQDAIASLQKFLPSNNDEDDELWRMDSWPAMDVYSCDDFRMYEFKVRRCMRGRSHDWTECPFAHPGEKARRRDPRKFHYSGTACPDFRKGNCQRGESCEYAHGVFECWLHPARYRTQPCKDGRSCRRRVCFFAHTTEQLRILPAGGGAATGSPAASLATSPLSCTRSNVLKAALNGGAYDGSPLRQALTVSLDGTLALELLYEQQGLCKAATGQNCAVGRRSFSATPSPTSTLLGQHTLSPPTSPSSPGSSSPPQSPHSSPSSAWLHSPSPRSSPSTNRRHIDRLHSFPTASIPPLDDQNLVHPTVPSDIHSPGSMNDLVSTFKQLHFKPPTVEPSRMVSSPWSFAHYPSRSVPGTPRSRYACKDDLREAFNEFAVPTQQVDSGRDLSEKMSSKNANENTMENDAPDFDWVNELVK